MTEEEKKKLKELDEVRSFCLTKEHLTNVYKYAVEEIEKLAMNVGYRTIHEERISRISYNESEI